MNNDAQSCCQDDSINTDQVPLSSGKTVARMTKDVATWGHEIWYDTAVLDSLSDQEKKAMIERLPQGRCRGVIVYRSNMHDLAQMMSPRLQRILHLDTVEEWNEFSLGDLSLEGAGGLEIHVVSSSSDKVLNLARSSGYRTCLRTRVDDADSLHRSYQQGVEHDYLMVAFKDSTNIPLELVIAELHKTDTKLLKEVSANIDDAMVAMGVLEMGSDGVVVSFKSVNDLDSLERRMDASMREKVCIQVGEIQSVRHLGMGYRTCIDTTHMFEEDEGILVGSTSTGGFLCCPEVFFLPYMELRPFRVNAASVHSYVFQSGDRTNYISELKAGSTLTAVNARGDARQIYVGRVKTEIRPLLLVEALFPGNSRINIIMQDDWHVRVFSDQAKPLNITDLKAGDRVLGFVTEPGRHVGVRVDEHIIES